jgi:hypothetical protein
MTRITLWKLFVCIGLCVLTAGVCHAQIINDPPPTPGPVDLTVSGYASGATAMLTFSQKCTDGTNEPIDVYESTGDGDWNYVGQASVDESGGQFWWESPSAGTYYFYGVETVKWYNESCTAGTYTSNTVSITTS